MNKRDTFEQWFKQNYYACQFARDSDNEYLDHYAAVCWEAWKAATEKPQINQAKHLCANYCSRYNDEQCSTCMINDEPEKPNTLLGKVAHEAQLIQRMSGIVAAIDSYSCVELANISNRLFLLVDGSHETN